LITTEVSGSCSLMICHCIPQNRQNQIGIPCLPVRFTARTGRGHRRTSSTASGHSPSLRSADLRPFPKGEGYRSRWRRSRST